MGKAVSEDKKQDDTGAMAELAQGCGCLTAGFVAVVVVALLTLWGVLWAVKFMWNHS